MVAPNKKTFAANQLYKLFMDKASGKRAPAGFAEVTPPGQCQTPAVGILPAST